MQACVDNITRSFIIIIIIFCLFFMYVKTDIQNRRDKNVLGLGIKVACWFVCSSMFSIKIP